MSATYLGTDGTTEHLLTVHDDGTAELAERPDSSNAGWSAPTYLRQLDAGFCCCGHDGCSDKAVSA